MRPGSFLVITSVRRLTILISENYTRGSQALAVRSSIYTHPPKHSSCCKFFCRAVGLEGFRLDVGFGGIVLVVSFVVSIPVRSPGGLGIGGIASVVPAPVVLPWWSRWWSPPW
jgi:hypothetical protein